MRAAHHVSSLPGSIDGHVKAEAARRAEAERLDADEESRDRFRDGRIGQRVASASAHVMTST